MSTSSKLLDIEEITTEKLVELVTGDSFIILPKDPSEKDLILIGRSILSNYEWSNYSSFSKIAILCFAREEKAKQEITKYILENNINGSNLRDHFSHVWLSGFSLVVRNDKKFKKIANKFYDLNKDELEESSFCINTFTSN